MDPNVAPHVQLLLSWLKCRDLSVAELTLTDEGELNSSVFLSYWEDTLSCSGVRLMLLKDLCTNVLLMC